jgi:hypothetical protein
MLKWSLQWSPYRSTFDWFFSIHNGLKQGNALSQFFSNFALQYVIRKVKENQVGLKLNDTPASCLCFVNVLGNKNITIKNKKDLLYDSKSVGLEVNTEKIKYVYVDVSSSECRTNHEYS